MMKRKVSVIWVVVLALIAIAACAFAAVTYYRCEKQPEPQFPQNELLRILDAGSDAEGVGFEVMRIGGGSVNLRLDLRWKNDSGKTIAYGQAFELYQMKDGVWQKVTPARQVDYPDIGYSIPSGMDNELSYDLTAPYHLIAGERYRLQTEFRYEEGTEYSEPMANWVEFEVKMNLPYKETQPSDPITIPELQVNAMSGAMGETDEITASSCAFYWQSPEPNEDGTMSSIIGCGPEIGEESSLPEITAVRAGLVSHRKSNEVWLYFEVQPDTVRIQCVPQNGGEVETITDILPYDGGYAFDLKSGSFVYRVIAEWDDGNRVEYGFIGKWLRFRGNQNKGPTMIKILLVEDDKIIVASLSEYLNSEGYLVRSVSGQAAAMKLLAEEKADLVLLDVSLAEGNGFAACRAIKAEFDVPVIFLTASGDEFSTVTGFDLGADDYIPKPFRPRELISRIRNVLRLTGSMGKTVKLGDVMVDTEKGTAVKNNRDLFLSALEYRLLLFFINNRGIVLTRERLLDAIWDVAGEYVNDNTLTVYIKRLREKIEDDPTDPKIILTVRGTGYKVDA